MRERVAIDVLLQDVAMDLTDGHPLTVRDGALDSLGEPSLHRARLTQPRRHACARRANVAETARGSFVLLVAEMTNELQHATGSLSGIGLHAIELIAPVLPL